MDVRQIEGMKIIITGATGFVGKAVVEECIQNPLVTSIIVLTRRPISDELSANVKVTTILHDNFEQYPDDLLDRLKGAQGCIWTIGGKVEDFPDIETARKISVGFTLAAAEAFATSLASSAMHAERFKFVFCSGRGAEWDESKALWMFKDTRQIKGQVEKGLFEISNQHKGRFDVAVLRPGGVLTAEQAKWQSLVGVLVEVVSVEQLAHAMVVSCLDVANENAKIIENEEISKLDKKNRS